MSNPTLGPLSSNGTGTGSGSGPGYGHAAPPSSSKPKKRPSTSTSGPRPSVPLPPDAQSPPPDAGAPDPTKIRAYAACKACRTKKIKCLPAPSPSASASAPGRDGSRPGTCQQCLQSGSECTYPPTRDRAAYSRQYVQNLEGRVQALEMMQARLMPLLDAFEGGDGDGDGAGLGDGEGIIGRLREMRAGRGGEGRRDGVRGRVRKMEPDDEFAPKRDPTTAVRDGDMDVECGPEQDTHLETEPEPEPEGDAEADAEVDELDSASSSDGAPEDTGQMAQDERGNYRWIGTNNTLSLLDSFSGAPTRARPAPDEPSRDSATNPYFAPVAGAGVIKALPTVDEVMYPAPAVAERFIDAYFQEIHPILPVMSEHEFRKGYAAVMERRERGEPEQSGIFISVIFAVFALGERVLVTSLAWQREKRRTEETQEAVLPGEAEAGVIWYERAQILRYTTITDISLHQVQALTLMAAFQASVNAMPMSWLLCGMALRMAQDLGLHRSTARLRIPFIEKQVRARCWWAAYGLDRLVSLTLGRPVGVDDQDIDVAYPADIDDAGLASMQAEPGSSSSDVPPEPTRSVMSGFTALTKLCKIAGRINHALYRPSHGRSLQDPHWVAAQQALIHKLDKSLRDWLDGEVPTKYKDPSQDKPIQLVSAVLSNSYFACLITLHRNILPPSPDADARPRPPPSTQSLSHCVAAARSVIHIAAQSRVLLPPSHHLALSCHYLWNAAVLLLLCEVQAKDQVVIDAVGSQVESTRRSLRALEPVWPGSKKLRELLTDAEQRAKEVVAASTAAAAAAAAAGASGGAGGVGEAGRIGRKRKTSHDAGMAKRPSLSGAKRSSSTSTTRGSGRGARSPVGGTAGAGVSGAAGKGGGNSHGGGGGGGVPSPSPLKSSAGLPRLSGTHSQYETSDTRTLVHDDNTASYGHPHPGRGSISSSNLGPGHNASQGLSFHGNVHPNPLGAHQHQHQHQGQISPISSMDGRLAPMLPPPLVHQASGSGSQSLSQQPQPLSALSQDFTFDVGGIDFNGLEMLQGFQGDFASLWSSLINEQYAEGTPMASASGGVGTTPTMSTMTPMHVGMGTGPGTGPGQGQGQGSMSGMSGVGAVGGGVGSNGPSPHTWAQQLTPGSVGGGGSGVGMGGYGLPGPGSTPGAGGFNAGQLSDLTSSEFWSAVAGAGQDWGADPNVPFNI